MGNTFIFIFSYWNWKTMQKIVFSAQPCTEKSSVKSSPVGHSDKSEPPHGPLCAPSPTAGMSRGSIRYTCWRTPAAPSGWQCGHASLVGWAGWSGRWWGPQQVLDCGGSVRITENLKREGMLSPSQQRREKEDVSCLDFGSNFSLWKVSVLKRQRICWYPPKMWPWMFVSTYMLQASTEMN